MLLRFKFIGVGLGLCWGLGFMGCATQDLGATLDTVTLPAPEPIVQAAPVVPLIVPSLPEPVVAHTPLSIDPFVHVLNYFERLRNMSAVEVGHELERLNRAPGGAATTLETALALASNRSQGDLTRALSLLESLLRINTPEVTPWQPIARFLAIRLNEQRKLEDIVDRLTNQLKEAQRDSQRKIDLLNEKLEALKAIERSLTVRQPALGGLPNLGLPALGGAAGSAGATLGSSPSRVP